MKVSVAALKAAIVKYQKDDEVRFRREKEAFDIAVEHNRRQHIANVAKYLGELRRGEAQLDSYNLGHLLSRGCKSEKAPSKASSYGDLLKKLDLCVSETVVVDDKSEYMRFLSGKCVC